MIISGKHFLETLKNPDRCGHNIVFLGMSGTGKTHWSKVLAERFNIPRIEIDEVIGNSKEIMELIKHIPGKDHAERMGKYFGMPWEEGFREKEAHFLEIEKKILSRDLPPGAVIDLTGSSIYHEEEMRKIADNALVIVLETSPEAKKEMLHIYLSNPKPVCWNGTFEKKEGESDKEALERCYPLLLKHREELYSRYANVKLEYNVHKKLKDINQFIEEVARRLDAAYKEG